MARPSGIMKNDTEAIGTWGSRVYADIPKSVFAVLAWHLANAASGTADTEGAAEKRFLEEWDALFSGNHLPQELKGKLRSTLLLRAETAA